jgi:hypothetical protein
LVAAATDAGNILADNTSGTDTLNGALQEDITLVNIDIALQLLLVVLRYQQ